MRGQLSWVPSAHVMGAGHLADSRCSKACHTPENVSSDLVFAGKQVERCRENMGTENTKSRPPTQPQSPVSFSFGSLSQAEVAALTGGAGASTLSPAEQPREQSSNSPDAQSAAAFAFLTPPVADESATPQPEPPQHSLNSAAPQLAMTQHTSGSAGPAAACGSFTADGSGSFLVQGARDLTQEGLHPDAGRTTVQALTPGMANALLGFGSITPLQTPALDATTLQGQNLEGDASLQHYPDEVTGSSQPAMRFPAGRLEAAALTPIENPLYEPDAGAEPKKGIHSPDEVCQPERL